MIFEQHEGTGNQAFPLLFEPFLFNEPRHRAGQCQPGDRPLAFSLRNAEGILVRLSVFLSEGKAVSPRRATFGGLEAAEQVTTEILIDFLAKVLHSLQGDISFLSVTQYPEALSPVASFRIREALLATGFRLSNRDLNYHIPVSAATPESRFHRGERWKTRKAAKMGFVFREITSPEPEVLQQFVVRARERKGHRITLFPGLFRELFQGFPEDVLAFGVFDNERLIALAVTIRLSKDTVYTFHLADDGDYARYSPTVFLVQGLYGWCHTNGYRILDLGIATDHGEPNEGLIRFKKNLGAEESEKNTFTYRFGEK